MQKSWFFGKEIEVNEDLEGRATYRDIADGLLNHRYILNNEIIKVEPESWELYCGSDYDEEEDYYYDIFQWFIIDGIGAKDLKEYTDEIVYYNENLNMYLWAVTHWGTAWDYVDCDVRVNPYWVKEEDSE